MTHPLSSPIEHGGDRRISDDQHDREPDFDFPAEWSEQD